VQLYHYYLAIPKAIDVIIPIALPAMCVDFTCLFLSIYRLLFELPVGMTVDEAEQKEQLPIVTPPVCRWYIVIIICA